MKAKLVKETKGLTLNTVYSVDLYKGSFVDVYDKNNYKIGTWHISRFDFQ
ncbi:hypothetical protein [Paenibacillus sp. ISL-20]|nr:hypothetical protein [Paenibacillus sp. ISL-20]MBT2759883.1 hypothetical protein [Paenibacillus sp. ISL-20]